MGAAQLFEALIRPHARFAPLLKTHVPADGIVIDAAAESGGFIRLLSAAVPAGHVYAFAPAQRRRAAVSGVIARKGLKNVSLLPLGLGGIAAEKTPQPPVKPSGGGCPVIHAGRDGEERITLTTLDQFVFQRGLRRIDLVKTGGEGLEMGFLPGAHHALERFRPALLINSDPRAAEEAARFLHALGYSVRKIGNGGAVWCVPEQASPAKNG